MGRKRDTLEEDVTTVQRDIKVEILDEEGRPHALELVKGPGAPRVFVLSRDKLIVGRGRDADISVDSAELSRKHASITRVETDWLCEDLESRNGVYLNGIKVHSVVLRDGDRLQFGELVFVYHEGR